LRKEAKMAELSFCGVNCAAECHAYNTDCEGCLELDGKVSWAAFYGKEYCPIVECLRAKGLNSCSDCGLAPCDVWILTRNPKASDAEFQADIERRLRNLEEKAAKQKQ